MKLYFAETINARKACAAAVGAALPYAERAQLPLEGLNEIARWKARLEALPAWSNPFPAAKAA